MVSLRRLDGTADDVALVERILMSAPTYSQRVEGRAPEPEDAVDLFVDRPSGVSPDAKRVFAVVSDDGIPIGVADVVAGWPDDSTAMLGLLVIREDMTGRGNGRQAYEAIEQVVRQWHGIARIRLAVIDTNADVTGFWLGMGFVATGQVADYAAGAVQAKARIFVKSL